MRGGGSSGKGAPGGGAGTCPASGARAPMWMVIVAFAVLVVLALAVAWRLFFSKPPAPPAERFALGQSPVPKPGEAGTLVYVRMNGCGWCEKFTPTWREFVAEYGAPLEDAGVRVMEVEAGDAAARLAQLRLSRWRGLRRRRAAGLRTGRLRPRRLRRR